MIRFLSVLQTNWDWRAAGNFMLGGAGSSLLFMAVCFSYPQGPSLLISLIALALMGGGLFCVWLEIGRPWRFINVFFHPQTSWMTREGAVAVLLFALAIIGVVLQNPLLMGLAGILGLVFLYCQGRILKASKGIPTWREPAIVRLICATGLCEGTAILMLLNSLQAETSLMLTILCIVLLAVRIFSWLGYRKNLSKFWLPEETLSALGSINSVQVAAGTLVPVVLLVLSMVMPGIEKLAIVCASLLIVFGGWHMKFSIVTRAAQNQGFAFGKIQRGRPKIRPPISRAST